MSQRFEFKERKHVRAKVIERFIAYGTYRGCVCFSCGNAAEELSKLVYTIKVCPHGDFQSVKWWSGEEIHRAFPDLLDATSGHLPLWMMCSLSERYKELFGNWTFREAEVYLVPTGSGETIIALSMAYPHIRFRAEYNTSIATAFQQLAPCNTLVEALTNK